MDARETTVFTAILIGVVIVVIVLSYFLISVIRLHRRYILLHKSKTHLQIASLESERTRIAADLHDELGPILSAAKFKLTEAEPFSPYDRQLLEEAGSHIDKMIGRIREIANGLMPNTLIRKGPFEAIEEFINVIQSSTAMRIELRGVAALILTQTEAVCIYRILQESIHNAIKHARANRMTIRFSSTSGTLIITCEDDGNGFDSYREQQQRKGLGLQNMLIRTEMMGGSMFIQSAAGSGTTLKFEIPLTLLTENNHEESGDQYYHRG